jgi:LysR family cys regulon transcriptional activator
VKLQQLKYFLAVVDNGFNVTQAAEALHTSQPGISKQIRLLEDELGLHLFVRFGKRIEALTPAGEMAVERVRAVVQEVHNIKNLAAELRGQSEGTLRLATTHTQARYVLPAVIEDFHADHPDIVFDLHQGSSEQLAAMAGDQQVDFVIATGSRELFPNLVIVPLYRWDRVLLVPAGHPLADHPGEIGLKDLVEYPLVTYVFSDRPESSLMQAFTGAGLIPRFGFTARDVDIIKTYVRRGLGVGVVATMAVEEGVDDDLVMLEATRLFPRLTTWIGFRRDLLLRNHHFAFLALVAPHLGRRCIDLAIAADSREAVDMMFDENALPVHQFDGIKEGQLEDCG